MPVKEKGERGQRKDVKSLWLVKRKGGKRMIG